MEYGIKKIMTEKNPGVYPRSVSARLDAGEYYVKGLAIAHVSLWGFRYKN